VVKLAGSFYLGTQVSPGSGRETKMIENS